MSKTSAAKLVLAGVLVAAPVHAQTPPHWVAAWASAQMPITGKYALPPEETDNVILRQIVRISLAGRQVRVHLSNLFGTTPLVITQAAVARAVRPGSADLAGDSHPLTFAGQPTVTIEPGAEAVSDPVGLPVEAFTDLAVTLWQPRTPSPQTGHIAARATSFATMGGHVTDPSLAAPIPFEHWYELSGVDVDAPPDAAAVAVIGDSISDGTASATDANARWPDFLARRLGATGRDLAVIDLGIGGNRVLHDGNGPSAMSRFGRDVLGRDGVRYVVIFEGVNDLGTATRDGPISPEAHAALVRQLEAADTDMIAEAHARSLKVIGATIAPFGGNRLYHPDDANEADRQALNAWIRAPGHFDGVIDFDAVLRDPAAPDRLKTEYDSGDHLHPGPGYAAMAAAVDLDLFRP